MDLFHNLGLVVIGLAGGLAVGSGLVAFITVLDIIPRLTQFTHTRAFVRPYQYALVVGAVGATWIDFRGLAFSFPFWSTILIGLLLGSFVGLLAGALTEVLNVLPILAKRLKMGSYLLYLLMAMVFGKVTGSLFQWLFF